LNFAPLHDSFHNPGCCSEYSAGERKIVKYYPVFWDIKDKKCIVVGGGDVAWRKIRRLRDCGAAVLVISPELTPELTAMKAEDEIQHVFDQYDPQYLEGAVLVIGATDDEKTNAAISQDARERGIPVNIVDDPQKCDFILPSVAERGDLTIAVGTGGKSPALARYLREELEIKYGPEYGILLNILGRLRPQIKNSGTGRAWLDSLIACGILDSIRTGDWEKVKRTVQEITGEEVAIE
jgi:precorrin-2 dehydrogenase / sirohydrochlorin ferrochelatase